LIAGLVLAAGAGRRFGDAPKQLADLRGRPLLQHAVDAAVAAEALERVVVVLGARAEEVRAAIDFGRAEPVVCPDWEEGQAASLRCGLRAVGDAERIVVTLGDQPWVGTEAIMRLARHPSGTRAAYDGVPGHPVVLGGELAAAALALEGDEGARGLLRGARTVECGDVADARDVDTVGDLKEMLT
jgi:CTP:molybdopterin cytidylyltransferase MocA